MQAKDKPGVRIAGRHYITGRDRNEDDAVAHLYRGNFENPGNPMCVRGWNRLDGHGWSIFRNLPDVRICKVCLRRAREKREPVKERTRVTKWI